MKTYEEMAHDALRRIEDHKEEQIRRRKAITAPVVSLCLVAVLALGAWQSGLFNNSPAASYCSEPDSGAAYCGWDDPSAVPNSGKKIGTDGEVSEQGPTFTENAENVADKNENTDPQIIAGDDSEQKGADTGTANDACRFWWRNKLVMYGDLYWALGENPDGVFYVLARFCPTTGNVSSFSYEGKTLAEWAIAAFEENAPQEAKESYKLAYNAYLETVLPAAASRLSESGIPCERAPYRQDSLTFTATAQELEALPLEDLQSWVFALASDDLKSAPTPKTDDVLFAAIN